MSTFLISNARVQRRMNMWKIFTSLLVILLLSSFLVWNRGTIQQRQHHQRVKLIVDTDIGPWSDDVGALAMLHAYAEQGRVELLAVMSNNAYQGAVSVIEALNRYFHLPSLPIGITKDPAAYQNPGDLAWPEYMVTNFPHPVYKNNSQAPDAATLYRHILSGSSDRSVTILSIGYLTNLANLLQSQPDELSPLSGADLVRSKVLKIVAVAGGFPRGNATTNVRNQTAAAQFVFSHLPTTPVIFVGHEVGLQLRCGADLAKSKSSESPVLKIFTLSYAKYGRIDGCWDEAAALVAVEGAQRYFELSQAGFVQIFANGSNSWKLDPKGTQRYLKFKLPVSNESIVAPIDALLGP